MASAKRPAKVQRWIDLIAALLRHSSPIDFNAILLEVPAYKNERQKHDARMRMFERDKDELRELGVPIVAVADEEGNHSSAYRLESRSFYLPYVVPATPGRIAPLPRRPAGPGYQRLPVLDFTPDQLAMVARAADRVQQMRHASLAADAATALRKLAFDVSFAQTGAREVTLHPVENNAAVLDVLDQAVRRRKYLTFKYRSMERDEVATRRVSPLGLLFINGVWYLLAWDNDVDDVRHFRVSRVSAPAINKANAQKPDFKVPEEFDLWEHAQSRQAWELGDDDATTVTVKFDATNAYAVSGAELGERSKRADCREFRVRRPDAFVRWLLSFGGAARPVAPKSIVTAWRALAEATAKQYGAAE